ncbi:ShlB/FhaC/HecB family hemolysin secretion/activation protein [Paraneptunicella aestuarii]|uniref:ShlB/FhaC/HecB family hemolysin secretion/activation protein n=1 Tax=Paraneptunicella aestuarii TaxID=2831148 RepID=UPI001E489059|nr:ShlB/FhaC/HecB family hemolysin secretion/activation protein [Paraneptunicella aestuarii]UAA37622.1 ShlB/FhaC/HecB family hemolysin secretion/activation protein [Paraneptunicella aestuarii]
MESCIKRNSPRICGLLLCFALGSVTGNTHASNLSSPPTGISITDTINNRHERIIKEGNDRIQNELSPLIERKDVFLQQEYQPEQINQVEDEDATCFTINTVNIDGITLFSNDIVQAITSRYTSRCLTLTHINNLVSELSNLYLENGYVTSRAYIIQQDLSDGDLELVVLEGFVESIQSNDNTLSERELALAFPVDLKDKLNIRDLEQGLENLNRLGKNTTTMAMEPGKEQGGSIVGLQNQPASQWRSSIGINNTGVSDTGEYQADANFTYENLLGLNESLIASVSSNVGGHDLPVAQSRSYSLVASMPYGYWMFGLNNSYFEYKQSVIGTEVNFLTHGTSLNSSLSANYTLMRDQAEKLQLSLAFTRKQSKNYIEDVFLETSSRILYIWDLAGTYVHHLPEGSLDATLHVNKSVPWWDAKRELAVAEDDFQFTKYFADVGFSSKFELLAHPIQYRTSLHLLYAPNQILVSEGVSVGGRYSVRGLSQGLSGYRGGYLRTDFHAPLPWQLPWGIGAQLHFGLDVGASNTPYILERHHTDWVAGSILGLQLYYESLNLNVSYAHALRTPDYLDVEEHELDFSLRVSF